MRPLPLALAALALAASLAAAAPARASLPASIFDAPGQHHADACVPLATGSAALRYGDGSPTGFSLTGDQLSYDLGSCPGGTATLDLHELIPSGAGPLAFHRGGSGYVDRGNVKYGELAASDLGAALPPPVPSSGGRGAPCPLAPEPPYRVEVQGITSRMHYKSTGGASYAPYGDPAASQGDNDGTIHYTYLLWSWVDVAGGGTVRTLLGQGQVVQACDVAPVVHPAYDSNGDVNGQVTVRYVRTLAGSCPLYGWMVWTHTYFGNRRGTIAHASALGGPPPPEPAPDPACPVAEAASPPIVSTGAAHGGRTSVVLTGSVNPKGVPTSYRFQFGPTPAYGAVTGTGTLGSPDQVVAATAHTTALRPGVTYHYRLVAQSTHGAAFGADRLLVPPRITGLKVRPGKFKRARHRKGKAARMRFNLSARATVRVVFLRRVRGRRVPVRGSLTQRSKRGRVVLTLSGWLHGRRLPRGRYVVQAQPRDGAGMRGATRTAKFTVR
jgi:hypothetical protein